MSNSDNLFNGLVGKAINEGINSTNEKNTSAQVRLFLALAGILLFIGTEAVRIVFRKNFGIKGINMFRLIVCFLCFLGIGILGLSIGTSDTSHMGDSTFFSQSSFIICGVFYILLAFYILRKGIKERIKAVKNQVYTDFTGESDLLSGLTAHGWSQNKIQYLGEPLYTLLFGAVLAIYNPMAAIPIIFCGLSVWVHFALEFIFLQNPLQPNIQHKQPHELPQQPHELPQLQAKPNRVNTDF